MGDHRLHLDCQGTGGPTVVLFNGMGEFSASWARITDPVSTTTRVCAYDRAGQGWSDDVASPQDGVTAAAGPARPAGRGRRARTVRAGRALHRRPLRHDLRRDLPRAGRRHGAAGQLQPPPVHRSPRLPHPVRRHAARPGDPAHAGTRGPAARSISSGSPLPDEDAAVVEAMGSTPRAFRNGRDEISMVPRVFEQAQALTTLGSRPLAVVTASENLGNEGWPAAQDRHGGLVHRQPPHASPSRPTPESSTTRTAPPSRCAPSPPSSTPSAPGPPSPRPEHPFARHPPPTHLRSTDVPRTRPPPRDPHRGGARTQEVLGPARDRPGRPDPGRPRHLRGQHRPPDHRTLPAPRRQQPAVARHGVRDDVRRRPPARRTHLRPAVTTRRLPDRPRPLHRRLPGQRVRRQRCAADRRPCRPGPQRRPADPLSTLPDHDHLRRVAAQGRTRPVGSGRQPRRRRRRPRRRSHHHLDQLAVHLLDQRPRRSRRPGGGAAHHRQAERDPPQGRRLRHPRRRHRHRRSRHDGLRPRRHRDPRLVVGPDHDRAAGVRRAAGRLPQARAARRQAAVPPARVEAATPWSPGRR